MGLPLGDSYDIFVDSSAEVSTLLKEKGSAMAEEFSESAKSIRSPGNILAIAEGALNSPGWPKTHRTIVAKLKTYHYNHLIVRHEEILNKLLESDIGDEKIFQNHRKDFYVLKDAIRVFEEVVRNFK